MICIAVAAKTEKELLKDIKKAAKKADLVELRLDYLRNPAQAGLKNLIKAEKIKKIITVRSKKEGGKFKGTEKERIQLLKNAASAGAHFIDLEFSTPKPLRKELIKNKKRSKIILSYHNFKETPPVKNLSNLFAKMRKENDVYAIKIVTKAKRESDIINILDLLLIAHPCKRKLITFAMGEKGKKSRALALMNGSFLTYASLGKTNKTAPGQLTVAELKKLLKKMGA